MPLLPQLLVSLLATILVQAKAPTAEPVEAAVIESSLPTGGSSIRQFAFDGNPTTYFTSGKNPKKSDHLTLTFDKPVAVKSIAILSGDPKGENTLNDGVLEISTDGTAFASAVNFTDGKVLMTQAKPEMIKAMRIRATKDLEIPLVIREITIDSTPKVAIFKYPVEFTLDVADAPEMKEWGEKVIRICEKNYALICDELSSKGFTPMTQIKMSLKSDYKGVAQAGGGRITGSVKFFKEHPDDIGAMIHETAHCVQNYKARNLPGWLVEGIADYVRFWKYEPGKAGKLQPERAKYDASYRITAAFLAYASEKYDPKLVNKLNAMLRENKYDSTAWKTLTGKTVEELNQEWRQSLVK